MKRATMKTGMLPFSPFLVNGTLIFYMAPFAAVAALAVYTLGRHPHGE